MADNRISIDGIAPSQLIRAMHILQLITALKGDFVGRGPDGNALAGQNLGTSAVPWATAYVNNLVVNGRSILPFIQSLISAQEGSRSDDLLEAFVALATIEGQASTQALTFSSNVAQELSGGGGFIQDGVSLLRITGYDPIPLWDNFYLSLPVAVSGSALNDDNSESFVLSLIHI